MSLLRSRRNNKQKHRRASLQCEGMVIDCDYDQTPAPSLFPTAVLDLDTVPLTVSGGTVSSTETHTQVCDFIHTH